MPRARKPKAIAAPANAAVPVPIEEDAHSALTVAAGTDHPQLRRALLSAVIGSLGGTVGTEAHAERAAAALALMAAAAPRDGIEGALAAQFAALHNAGMAALRRAAGPEMPVEVSSRLRRDAVLAFRAMGEVVETIQTKRGGGAVQRITVEHISQPIIGVPGGGGRE